MTMAKRFAGWEDLQSLPEGVRGEIVAGQVVLLPRPSAAHGRAAVRLSVTIAGPFGGYGGQGPGGWVFIQEPDVVFLDEIRVPDLVGYRAERYEEPEKGPLVVIPDWVCEILSPSNELKDRVEKMRLYARAAVPYVWLVDPLEHTVEAYRLEGKAFLLTASAGGGEKARLEPFDAVELELGLLWPEKP